MPAKGTHFTPEVRAKLSALARSRSAETRERMSAAQRGRTIGAEARSRMSMAAKSRVRKDPDWYLKVGKQFVHRAVMEAYLGRPLTRAEVVHHVDRTDNRIENLRLMTYAEHNRLHRAEQRGEG